MLTTSTSHLLSQVIEKAYKKLRLDALVIQQGRLTDNKEAKVCMRGCGWEDEDGLCNLRPRQEALKMGACEGRSMSIHAYLRSV